MAQAPNAAPPVAEHVPTPLEKLAKAVHGDQHKLLQTLSSQQRWEWSDVAVLITGSQAAVTEFIAKQSEEAEARLKETMAASEKRQEAADRALVEGSTARPGTATTSTHR
jgi:hypothetical protein